MVTVTIKIPETWLKLVDEWRRKHPELPNRSDALREAIKEKFVPDQPKRPTPRAAKK